MTELRGTRLSCRRHQDLELAAGVRRIQTCLFLEVSLIQNIQQRVHDLSTLLFGELKVSQARDTIFGLFHISRFTPVIN